MGPTRSASTARRGPEPDPRPSPPPTARPAGWPRAANPPHRRGRPYRAGREGPSPTACAAAPRRPERSGACEPAGAQRPGERRCAPYRRAARCPRPPSAPERRARVSPRRAATRGRRRCRDRYRRPSGSIFSAFWPQSCHLASDREFPDVVGVVISDDQTTPKEGVLAGTVGRRREEIARRIPDELDDGLPILVKLRERLSPPG